MLRYLSTRLLRNLITLFLFLTVVFFIAGALPGDYTYSFLLSPEQRAALQEELGLDQSLILRYFTWLRSMLSGELGWSLVADQPVSEVLGEYLPGTLYLFLTATVLSFLLGTWLGKLIAWRKGAVIDTLVSMSGMWLYASFPPLVAFLLVTASAGKLGWLPPVGMARTRGIQGAMFQAVGAGTSDSLGRIQRLDIYFMGMQPLMKGLLLTGLGCFVAVLVLLWATRRVRKRQTVLRLVGVALIVVAAVVGWAFSGQGQEVKGFLIHSILPLLTLVLVFFGEPMLLMRTAMMETMRDDYVVTAQAKGMKSRHVRDRHAARTALLPVVSRMLLSLPLALTGSLVVEMIFSWPGMGSLLLVSVDFKDYDAVVGIIAVVGILVVVAHVVLDILNAVLDPRVRSVAQWQGG